MPAKSQAQFKLMKAAENNPKFAKKVGIKPSVAKEFTETNVGKKSYKELPAKMAKGGVSLAIGRGEKLPASQGAGLTAKGREKYNRETGSSLRLHNHRAASEEIRSALVWVQSLKKARKEAAPEPL